MSTVTPTRGNSVTSVTHFPMKNKKRTLKENFQQQTLPAWQPIFSAGRVAPALLLVGLLFIPTGIGIWYVANSVQEVHIPYTDCINVQRSREYPEDFNKTCAEVINSTDIALMKNCKCRVKFEIEKNLSGPVFVYYRLTNFFQNHRKYVTSRDDFQLKGGNHLGDAKNPKAPAKACAPYDYVRYENGTKVKPEKIYVPCGAIANSMFNDEIRLYRNLTSSNVTILVEVPLNRSGIAWESDQDEKFNNPDWFDDYSNSTELREKFVKPLAWRKELWELDPENPDNNGLNNEDLINWMRVAALPDFRKLFRMVNQNHKTRKEFKDGLPAGSYEIDIEYYFPVKHFDGTKTIILSTTSIFGNSSPFLGITYVIVGGVCVLLALFLLLIHVKNRDRNRKVVHID